jgi:hypothetical protein
MGQNKYTREGRVRNKRERVRKKSSTSNLFESPLLPVAMWPE